MSESQETPEVIQGRLGWESGDISEANPTELTPHPKNREIYGDTEDTSDLNQTFIESVREKGVLEPLVITQDKQIISGHRRWLAAQHVGLNQVPVRVAEFDNELAEREALIEFNRQREKTPGQVVNEFDEILEIEQEKAKDAMSEGGKKSKPGERVGNVSNPSEPESARDKAAEKVNADVSGRTLEKGLKVKEKARDGDETAQEEWSKLERGETSYHTAYKNVEKAEAEAEVNQQQQPDSEHPPLVREQDAVEFLNEIESPDLVIADPPYSTDLDDVAEFAKTWMHALLESIGEEGQAFIFIGAYPRELQAYLNVLGIHNALNRTDVLVWTYRNTLGQTPKHHYKQNWQAILHIQSQPPTPLDAPKTSEQWAVQDINAPDARHGERHHEWQKPTELTERLIRHTTTEDDLVIDPFAGTGTTILTASKLGRHTIGADNDPEMLEIALERGCIQDA